MVKVYQLVLKILSGKENIIPIKDHKSVINFRKIITNNPNVGAVNINLHTEYSQIRY